jgi:4-hydroxybenzoate polyprenyltransferase
MAKWFPKNYYSLNTLTILPVYVLIEIYDVGYMDIYLFQSDYINFLCSLLVEFNRKGQYLLLHNVLKFIIVGCILHCTN